MLRITRAAPAVRPVTMPSCRICWYAPANVFGASWKMTGIRSRLSDSTRPRGLYDVTTRSGRYEAIASTFGVKPESVVFGAFFG